MGGVHREQDVERLQQVSALAQARAAGGQRDGRDAGVGERCGARVFEDRAESRGLGFME